ncbi:hypothetical protein AOLI_G00131650 [Acnodon oligacanthus]
MDCPLADPLTSLPGFHEAADLVGHFADRERKGRAGHSEDCRNACAGKTNQSLHFSKRQEPPSLQRNRGSAVHRHPRPLLDAPAAWGRSELKSIQSETTLAQSATPLPASLRLSSSKTRSSASQNCPDLGVRTAGAPQHLHRSARVDPPSQRRAVGAQLGGAALQGFAVCSAFLVTLLDREGSTDGGFWKVLRAADGRRR